MDQTGFSQNQEIFQAPPEPVKTPEQLAPPTPEELAKKKKQNLIIGIVFAVIVVLVVLIYLVTQVVLPAMNKVVVVPTPPPVSLPSNPDREQTEFGKKLEQIEEQIDKTDPKELDLDPPILDYNIRL